VAYTHTNFGQLKAQLATRLFDTTMTFWVDAELDILLREALRTFGLLTGFWRERATFNTDPNVTWYDLRTYAPTQLASTVTDRDIIQSVQYALLETATVQTSWTGTEQFTYTDITNALQNRLNQFLSDTGIVVTPSLVTWAILSVGNFQQALSQNTIDIRRVAWLQNPPTPYYNTLWREDERSFTAGFPMWPSQPQTPPESYTIMGPPPLIIRIEPPTAADGTLDILTVDSTTLNPSLLPTTLGIPDDLTPAIKWGVLADLLGKDGIASDQVRSQFCEKRYQQYVQLARLLPVVIYAQFSGTVNATTTVVPTGIIPCTLQELESSTPNWQNIIDTPQDIVLAAPNLIAFNPRADGIYSISLDVVRKTPMPTSDSTQIQIGREQLDTIVDYAEHLALFKVGGQEWHATERQADNFLIQSITYNQRISAAAHAVFSAAEQSQRQKQQVVRRLDTSAYGIGAVKAGKNA